MSRVLVLALAPEISEYARILRQVEFLASDFDVVLAARSRPRNLPTGAEFLELGNPERERRRDGIESAARIALRAAGLYGRAYWRDPEVRRLRGRLSDALPVDAIVVNDLFALPLARSLSHELPIVFDAHEHWTSESASWTRRQRLTMRRSHDWIVDRFVPETAGVMTVSRGIANAYQQRTGLSPRLVTNAPPYTDLEPSPVSDPIRLLHVGVADERRRLEDTVEAVAALDSRFTLDLVLMRENDYRRRIEQLVAPYPRIRVLPPVPTEELLRFANAYDIGVFLLPPRSPNQVHVLPNKLFDYIQARLAVAIGPSREMAEIVREWDCGVVSASFEADAFAASLRGLTGEGVARMKRNSDVAAGHLNADSNRGTVIEIVRGALAAATSARAGSG